MNTKRIVTRASTADTKSFAELAMLPGRDRRDGRATKSGMSRGDHAVASGCAKPGRMPVEGNHHRPLQDDGIATVVPGRMERCVGGAHQRVR
jgi:hypothetical protein